MKKIGFVSLGCSKNLVDTEVMLRNLHDAGYELTPDEAEADVIVVNTCGFIESAKRESIDNIIDLAELKKGGKCKFIIATGCLVERYREEVMRELERMMMLRVVDEYWMEHIDAMDDLKQGIGLRAYGQHDPVVAYKEEGFPMFEGMIEAIREETVRRLFLVQLRAQQEVKREKVAKETGTGAANNA